MENRRLPVRALVKIPRQTRSIEMVHAILDGVVVVLAQEGAARFSTNRVAAVAGVSVGSLYQYFANKEMLLEGVLERGTLESEELMRRIATADSSASVDDVLRQTLRELFAELEPVRMIIADIVSALPLGSQSGVLGVLETRIGDVMRDYLLRHTDRYRLVGGPAALYVGTNAIIYVFLKWLTEDRHTIEREELIEAMVAVVTAAIQPV